MSVVQMCVSVCSMSKNYKTLPMSIFLRWHKFSQLVSHIFSYAYPALKSYSDDDDGDDNDRRVIDECDFLQCLSNFQSFYYLQPS